ncbi:integrase [Clostridium kluyveri]
MIQALLGHIDINITRKTYVHVSETKKKEVANLLDNFLD